MSFYLTDFDRLVFHLLVQRDALPALVEGSLHAKYMRTYSINPECVASSSLWLHSCSQILQEDFEPCFRKTPLLKMYFTYL